MKYAKANSGEVVSSEDYSKEIIFTSAELPGIGHQLQTVTIPPQTKQREHFHDKETEVFFILSGECSIFLNNEEFIAHPGDAFICEPGDKHFFWNKSDSEFKLVVFKIDLPEGNDTHWLKD